LFRRKENIPQIAAETGLPAGGRPFFGRPTPDAGRGQLPARALLIAGMPLPSNGRQLITKDIQGMVVDLQINIIQLLSHKGLFLVFLTETYFLYVL